MLLHLSVVLAILVMTAMHTVWLLEHPICSLIHRHNRFEWLMNSVVYAAWSYLYPRHPREFRLSLTELPYSQGVWPSLLANALGELLSEAHENVFQLPPCQDPGPWYP